jgi:hypothetical protein
VNKHQTPFSIQVGFWNGSSTCRWPNFILHQRRGCTFTSHRQNFISPVIQWSLVLLLHQHLWLVKLQSWGQLGIVIVGGMSDQTPLLGWKLEEVDIVSSTCTCWSNSSLTIEWIHQFCWGLAVSPPFLSYFQILDFAMIGTCTVLGTVLVRGNRKTWDEGWGW